MTSQRSNIIALFMVILFGLVILISGVTAMNSERDDSRRMQHSDIECAARNGARVYSVDYAICNDGTIIYH
jgi:hypothetical protein